MRVFFRVSRVCSSGSELTLGQVPIIIVPAVNLLSLLFFRSHQRGSGKETLSTTTCVKAFMTVQVEVGTDLVRGAFAVFMASFDYIT